MRRPDLKGRLPTVTGYQKQRLDRHVAGAFALLDTLGALDCDKERLRLLRWACDYFDLNPLDIPLVRR